MGLRADLGLPDAVALHGLRFEADEGFGALAAFLPGRLRGASLKRRREFIAGRLCASAALAQAGHAGPGWLGQDSHALPAWPEGWTGSISHSATLALAAVCPRMPGTLLGLDIEEIFAPPDIAGIASMVARPDELAILASMSPSLGVILLFSAKECLYKALYPQLRTFRDFSAARLVAAKSGHLTLRLEEDWGEHWRMGRLLEIRHARRNDHVVTALYLTQTGGDPSLDQVPCG